MSKVDTIMQETLKKRRMQLEKCIEYLKNIFEEGEIEEPLVKMVKLLVDDEKRCYAIVFFDGSEEGREDHEIEELSLEEETTEKIIGAMQLLETILNVDNLRLLGKYIVRHPIKGLKFNEEEMEFTLDEDAICETEIGSE